MNYRSIADLNSDLIKHLHRLPTHDLVGVLGIPRSGMLPATMISLHLNIPLGSCDTFEYKGFLQHGDTREPRTSSLPNREKSLVLVIDDSCATGKSINKAKIQLAEISDKFQFIFAAVYASPEAIDLLDFYFEKLARPRVFEWNLFHHESCNQFATDLDGVLCDDPHWTEDDQKLNYRKFIKNTKPKAFPTRKLGAIITGRSNNFRDETESWLIKHDIEYDQLIMFMGNTQDKRNNPELNATHKAKHYSKGRYQLFIESDENQAKVIHKKTKKSVLVINRSTERTRILSNYSILAFCRKVIRRISSLYRKVRTRFPRRR